MNSADDIPRFGGCPAEWTYSAYVDDELDAGRVAAVLAHLEECPECLAELEALVRLQRSLARLAPVS